MHDTHEYAPNMEKSEYMTEDTGPPLFEQHTEGEGGEVASQVKVDFEPPASHVLPSSAKDHTEVFPPVQHR